MPFYLLRITKRKWDTLADQSWLEVQAIQGDPLGDLRIDSGNLSVWHIEDDKSNLNLIITALASTRERLDKFEYGLFNQDILNNLGIEKKASPGNTRMERANRWHYDLIHLTTSKTVQLVEALFHSWEKERLLDKRICDLIVDAVRQKELKVEKLPKKLREEVEKHI